MWLSCTHEADRPRAGRQAPDLEQGRVVVRPAIAGTRRHSSACRVGFPRRVLGRVPGRRRPLLLGLPPSAGGVPWLGGPAPARGNPAVESTGGAPLAQPPGLPSPSRDTRPSPRSRTLAPAGGAGC